MARQPDEGLQRRAAKRTAIVLALVAIAFYVTFIMMGVTGQ